LWRSEEFWRSIGALGGQPFLDSLDYVGLDFFPDVFSPAADLRADVLNVLETMRSTWLAAAGIPATVPIHIAENGWPTGPTRSCVQQSAVLETIVRTLMEHRTRLNLARYTLFSLRDADSFSPESAGNIFHHFGLMRSDYTPKPAFETFRRLIAEFHGMTAPPGSPPLPARARRPNR